MEQKGRTNIITQFTIDNFVGRVVLADDEKWGASNILQAIDPNLLQRCEKSR